MTTCFSALRFAKLLIHYMYSILLLLLYLTYLILLGSICAQQLRIYQMRNAKGISGFIHLLRGKHRDSRVGFLHAKKTFLIVYINVERYFLYV